jgi:AcrR family transcriptional regulator
MKAVQLSGTTGRRRGRPRDAGRDSSILDATMELLEEWGYDQLTVKDIAERAGAGLGAIYRRWPNKLALVVAAVQAQAADCIHFVVTGDIVEDLSQAMMLEGARAEQRCIPGFISAMQHEPRLAAAVRDAMVIPKVNAFAQILSSEFDDPADCRLRAELALAILLHRTLIGIDLPDEQEIRDRLVPVILGWRPLGPQIRMGRYGSARPGVTTPLS